MLHNYSVYAIRIPAKAFSPICHSNNNVWRSLSHLLFPKLTVYPRHSGLYQSTFCCAWCARNPNVCGCPTNQGAFYRSTLTAVLRKYLHLVFPACRALYIPMNKPHSLSLQGHFTLWTILCKTLTLFSTSTPPPPLKD